MKDFLKGCSLQLGINLIAHLVRIVVAYLIIKYATEPTTITSFAKDSGWQAISLLLIIGYNTVSLFVSIVRSRKLNMRFLIGFCTISIFGGIYALKFCGL